MDKVLSTRLDADVIEELERATRELGMTKKRFLEEAIRLRATATRNRRAEDVWEETRGAWNRREPTGGTIRRARRAFEASVRRHDSREKS